ncbi:hypothetical protein TELCIR_11663 [Teladorsagia circumcincta]|uniref:Uncharacterized protein n=1 Tax=Teladorsagia circumcincta TaxID=45464 RepID=A0A2G9U8U9_TELCI|nr:hypothetical protein TELCIR_11663 [Teladorsagia circumcincta]
MWLQSKLFNFSYNIQGRSTEMQQSLRLLACNAIKLVEYFTIRGYQILRMVCEIPSNIDILICVLTTVGEAKLRFIKTMTSDCIDRDIGSMNLAISEMNDLELRTSQRIQQLQRKEAFGLPT